MNDPQRLNTFHKTLERCRQLITEFPDEWGLKSIEQQLLYLISFESGESVDRKRLFEINIGLLAVREVGDLDDSFTELLHTTSGIVRRMEGDS
ncbi:MAG: hypothetical protein H7144_04620 [Burkholderiales bacterium]|nr:hypothetical protein [Phycisphaerae bacterium]